MSSILPSNRTDLEEELETTVSRSIPDLINQMWNPDTCPAELLGYLAWAVAVFEWSDAWDESLKRDVIRQSISVYQHHGTEGSLKKALVALGYSHVQIFTGSENRYDGAFLYDSSKVYGDFIPAYQFDVILNTPNVADAAEILEIKRRIDIYKNARSHLRNLQTLSQFYDDTFNYDATKTYSGGII